MSEPLYQLGICPNCGPGAEQRFLFATEDRYGPATQEGRIVAYDRVETLSLFHCEQCRRNLVFLTDPEIPFAISVEELDLHEADEVAELDPDTFLEVSTLVWPKKEQPAKLPASVPENVRKIYEAGLRVKALDPDSFSVRVRRAIQAICIDFGAKEYDADGRRLDLLDNLKELEQKRIFSPQVTDVFHQFRYLGNLGAHSADETIKPNVADVSDELFRLMIQYIYEIPHKLDSLKEKRKRYD